MATCRMLVSYFDIVTKVVIPSVKNPSQVQVYYLDTQHLTVFYMVSLINYY